MARADFIHDEGPDLADEEDRGRKHHRAMLPEDDQQENVEDLEKFIQQRYGRQEYEEFDEAETTDVEQQALLPSVRDPKLWMVKCQVLSCTKCRKNWDIFCCYLQSRFIQPLRTMRL